MGSILDWVPIVAGQDNVADVAVCELDAGVDAQSIMHDHPNHGSRHIVAGVLEPGRGTPVTMLGARSGESTVTVKRDGERIPLIHGGSTRWFNGVVVIDRSQNPSQPGDSGAPYVIEPDADGNYRMCFIGFGGTDNGREGFAFPASVAQDELGITFGNRAPIANAGADQTVALGATVSLDGSGSSDPEGDTLTYSWTETTENGVTLKSPQTSVATFTAPPSPATLTFQLTVTDSLGQTATDTVSVLVGSPVANAGADQTVALGATVSLDGSGSSDPDHETLTYRWTQTAGTDVTLSSATAASPTFTAPSSPATLTFELTVTDPGGLSDSDQVVVSVGKPVANAGVDQTAAPGATVTLDGSGSSDPDRETLTYRWTQTAGTAVALSSVTAASPTFTAPSSPATLTFELTVTDPGGLSDSDQVSIIVNRAPIANAGADQTVALGATVSLDGSGSSDPDGDTLSYIWSQTGGTVVTLNNPQTSVATFTAPASAATLTFHLTVTDPGGLSDSGQVSVSVGTPVARAGADQRVDPGATVTLDGSGSSDPDSETLTYSWTQTAGTTVTLSSATAASPTFTAPSTPTTLTFQLTVTDPGGLSDSDQVSVAVNRAPTADASADQTVVLGATVTLDGSGSSDPDGEVLSYSWRQVFADFPEPGEAVVTLSSATAASPTFTAPSSPTTLTFELTVTDPGGLSDSDQVIVTVRAPETWGSWTRTGNTRGSCQNRQSEESRTSSYNRSQTRWVSDLGPEIWGSWSRTGTTRGSCQSREAQESRGSNCGNTQTRWVSDPGPEIWGSWTRTGTTRGSCQSREAQESRGSNCGNTQTRWVSYPEAEIWGSWTRTGTTRGSCQSREALESRGSNCGNTQTRWVYVPWP